MTSSNSSNINNNPNSIIKSLSLSDRNDGSNGSNNSTNDNTCSSAPCLSSSSCHEPIPKQRLANTDDDDYDDSAAFESSFSAPMREWDADILEQGIRPVSSSANASPIINPPQTSCITNSTINCDNNNVTINIDTLPLLSQSNNNDDADGRSSSLSPCRDHSLTSLQAGSNLNDLLFSNSSRQVHRHSGDDRHYNVVPVDDEPSNDDASSSLSCHLQQQQSHARPISFLPSTPPPTKAVSTALMVRPSSPHLFQPIRRAQSLTQSRSNHLTPIPPPQQYQPPVSSPRPIRRSISHGPCHIAKPRLNSPQPRFDSTRPPSPPPDIPPSYRWVHHNTNTPVIQRPPSPHSFCYLPTAPPEDDGQSSRSNDNPIPSVEDTTFATEECLSGDQFPYIDSPQVNERFIPDDTPSTATTSSAVTPTRPPSELATSGCYSKSIQRRLSEAAQFAEAVGELPPTSVGDISREIVEGTSSDEDDDDDDEEEEEEGELRGGDAGTEREERKSSRISNESQPFLESVNENPPYLQRDTIDDDTDDTHRPLPKSTPTTTTLSSRRKSCSDLTRKPLWAQRTHSLHHFYDSTTVAHNVQTLLRGLPSTTPAPFIYRGLPRNPPPITQRGLSRGNYAQLHRKAWLEVSDKYHRYGKNLRLYYKHWESLGHPTNEFFDWLDSHGEAAGEPLPNLPECPRKTLDSDTVRYITNPDVVARYALEIVPCSEVEEGRPPSHIMVDGEGCPINTGEDGWIFVLRDGVMYAAPKITCLTGKSKQRFHHSSFFGGKAVAGAGILVTNAHGRLTKIYPHSGHYRPGEAHMQRVLFFIQKSGIDLTGVKVDMQQIYHVSRSGTLPPTKQRTTESVVAVNGISNSKGESTMEGLPKKAKKKECLYLLPATKVAFYLTHKALMIGEGVFAQIHKIRRVKATCVTEALDKIDNGGIRKMVFIID